MANLEPSTCIPPPSPSPIGGGSGGAAVGKVPKGRKMVSAEQLVLDLCYPELRETALLELSKKREIFQDLAPLLWHSFGTVAALLQPIFLTWYIWKLGSTFRKLC